jgi:hypothetical protein
MTTLDPDARPTAAEAAAEFDALEGRMTGEEPPETQPMLAELFAAPAPVQQRARGPVAAALGVAAALVVGIGLLLSPAGLPAADVRAAAEPVTPVAAPTPTPTASRSAAPHSA